MSRSQQVELLALLRRATGDRCGCARSAARSPCAACRCTCPRRRRAESRTASSAFPGSGSRRGTWRRTPAGSGSRCPGRSRATSRGWAESAGRRRSSSAAATARGWARRRASSGSRRCRRSTRRRAGNSSLTSMPLWPYLRNLNGEGSAAPVWPLGRQVAAGQRLAGVLGERRLGVERVDVRRPAVHEQVDDVLGLGREVRRAAAAADWRSRRPSRSARRASGRRARARRSPCRSAAAARGASGRDVRG